MPDLDPATTAALLQQTAPPSMWERLSNAIFSGSAPKPSTFTPAPPLTEYPSEADAANARKYGFGYGSGMENYITGDAARVRGYNFNNRAHPQAGFIPMAATGQSLSKVANTSDETSLNVDPKAIMGGNQAQNLRDIYTQGALAANRIPIAALGYDPHNMVADVLTGPKANILGVYNPVNDAMYFNAAQENNRATSTPVHESIHRGLNLLRANPEAENIIDELPAEESVVRYLMATQAGDPERNNVPSEAGQRQRQMALQLFGHQDYKGKFDRLNEIAQSMIAARHPRGPI